MMGVPAPTQAQSQPHIPPAHAHGQVQHLTQQSQGNPSQQSKPGSTTSFTSVSAGGAHVSGNQGGTARKKTKIG